MANYCSNILSVSGDVEQLKDFKSKTLVVSDNNEYRFTFDILFPTPKELANDSTPPKKMENEREEDYSKRMLERVDTFGYDNWYDWRVGNWGTKWDAATTYFYGEENDLDFYVEFETAWSPPIDWLKKVALQFPGLGFYLSYVEESGQFCGLFSISSKGIVHEEGAPQYADDWGNPIYMNEDGSWYDETTNEKIADQNIIPTIINPFI